MGVSFRDTVLLRWVLLYINQSLFKGYCRPSSNFYFIIGTLHTQQKKIQRMNSPINLDGLHNSRCSNHNRWEYFFMREHLIKAFWYSQESGPHNLELRYRDYR